MPLSKLTASITQCGFYVIYSDQGSQYTSGEWQTFLDVNDLISSMSRRSNCHDNTVADRFFQLLKRERIRRRIYKTRREVKVEMFYNSTRKHGKDGLLSPRQYEDLFKMNDGVV